MGCLLVMLGAFFPRLGVLFVWLARPAVFEAAIPSALVAVLGIIFFPLTTLMYVLLWSPNGLNGFDWVWLALGVRARSRRSDRLRVRESRSDADRRLRFVPWQAAI